MKSSHLVFLLMGIALFYLGCSDEGPTIANLENSGQVTESELIADGGMAGSLLKKPSPTLTAAMYIAFVGPGPIPWDGEIEFEGYGRYGMRFYNLSGPPRGFSQASPFREYFEIYDLTDPSVIYLAGTDAGIVNFAINRVTMNGEVEVANAPFEMWLARRVHASGHISWKTLPDGTVMPDSTLATCRLN